MYRTILRNDVVPAIGTLKVATVEYADIDRLHAKTTKRAPYLANRMLTALSKMFALAILWRMRESNPARGVGRNQEQKRKRYLSGDEMARLTAALSEYPHRPAADAIRLMLLTGARRGEVLSATWDQLDLAAGIWTKPASTTKQQRDHVVPLSAPARQVLASIRARTEGPYVFPAREDGPRRNLKRHWARLCRTADITGLRMHDLRHSYAAVLASSGVGLHVIGGLLGHSSPTTTHRYAHLIDAALRAATEKAGAIIAGEPSAEVVALKGKRP
jgi:integrase